MALRLWFSVVYGFLLAQLSLQYFFEDGFNHHYTYSAESNIFHLKNVTTVLKFHIRLLNATYDEHRLHILEVDSFVQFTTDGLFHDNPHNWDLSKHFLFETARDGSISLVHVHPEDKKELVIIKKALASLFSVKVQVSNEKEWKYNTTENDHYGELHHEYHVAKTPSGMTLTRHHYSTERGHRRHQKVLHYDHRGTLQTATAHDSITLKNTPGKQRQQEPDEFDAKIDTSGDFPEIHTSAEVRVKLDGKKHHGSTWETIDGLTIGKLHTEEVKEMRRLSEVIYDIEKNTECIQNIPDVTNENRSECIHNLRKILKTMHEDDYPHHVETILNRTCEPQDSRCLNIRLVYIDLVARAGDVTSQEIILKNVLNVPEPEEDELRRVFVHCIVITNPTEEFLQAVERFCVGANRSIHGSTNFTQTPRRACLALGSLAKNIAKEDLSRAEQLVENLETWIEKHKEVNSTLRVKRDIPLNELNREEDDYILSRTTLIHSLGNAGLKRSLPHIRSHTHPNPVHHVWKRAAIKALRHYTCTESALALFESAMFDEDDSVRKMASEQYRNHPKGKEFTSAHKEVILRNKYTYPSFVRMKRDILDTVILNFTLELPEFDWKKVIGSEKIGASFGLKFENRIKGLFRPLSGLVDVNIQDKLFAEVHIGMMDWKQTIVLIDVCYKGGLKYNMNIFKDFSVDSILNMASSLDKMLDTVMGPVVGVTNNIVGLFQGEGQSTRNALFESFAEATKNIPNLAKDTLKVADRLMGVANKVKNMPFMTKFKEALVGMKSLVEDVRSDATGLFNKIADAAMVVLPYAEKEMGDAMDNVLHVIGKVSESPKQAFRALEEARLKFHLAMSKAMYANSIIHGETSLLKGGDIDHMLGMLTNMRNKLQQKARRRRSIGIESVVQRANQLFDTGIETVMQEVEAAVEGVYSKLDYLKKQAPKHFEDASNARQAASEQIKNQYERFTKVIEKAKSKILSVFGTKFHESFPKQRMECDGKCGCGTYSVEGVDLKVTSGKQIPCPVQSMVLQKDDTSLLLKPVGSDLPENEIVISNIKPSSRFSEYNETFVKAGENIGVSAGCNGCKTEHIHVIIKKKSASDKGFPGLDPSPFLDPLNLAPQWKEKCRHFTFEHIGQIFESDKLTTGFLKKIKDLVREGVKYATGLVMKEIKKHVPLPPSIMSSVDGLLSKLGDGITDANDVGNLFKDPGKHLKEFVNNIEVGNVRLKDVGDIIGSGDVSVVTSALKDVVSTTENMLGIPNLDIFKMGSSGLVETAKKVFNVPNMGGKLASLSFLKAAVSKVCPSFANGLARATGQSCIAAKDCLGIDCEIPIKIPHLAKSSSFKIGYNFNPVSSTMSLSFGGIVKQYKAKVSEIKELIDTGIDIEGFKVKLKLSAKLKMPPEISVTVDSCKKGTCIGNIPVFKHLRMERVLNNIGEHISSFSSSFDDQSLSSILDVATNFNLNTAPILGMVNEMRNGVRSALSNQSTEGASKFKNELQQNDAIEDKGTYPQKGKKNDICIQFLHLVFPFNVGPFIFKIEFSGSGSLGTDVKTNVKSVDSNVKTVFAPWVAGKLEASFAITIVIVEAGVELTGFLLKTKFPLVLETAYGKLPVKEVKTLYVELIPLELELKVYAKLLCPKKQLKCPLKIERIVWHWTSPTCKWQVFRKISYKNDTSHPKFPKYPLSGRNVRSTRNGSTAKCVVSQLKGRHIENTAFNLEVPAESDSSDLTLRYSIGTHPGGQDVMNWTNMSGFVQVIPVQLKNGVPLYWTVEVKNSQGLTSFAECKLDTYDNTLPDGRVQPSHLYTSHPHKLSATIVVFDDSPLLQIHNVSLGYSPGQYGREVQDEEHLYLNATSVRSGVSDVLRQFSAPRVGKMTAKPFNSANKISDVLCAKTCISYGAKCVSFDLELHTLNCFLYDVIEGPLSKLRASGSFHNYERLGIGYTSYKEYNVDLEHGARYYINAHIYNRLGYHGYLLSEGTFVDFTPPEPGLIVNSIQDVVVNDGCHAAITQRCKEVTWKPNHRNIIDGSGSKTVFTGHRPLEDTLYTWANNYMSANWDGFHDDESGIWGYTWAAGTHVCASDIAPFVDPFSSLASPKMWTYSGFASDLYLPDGQYYVTVQAVNSIVHGGALVTTVCHSTPITIDTSPPLFHEVSDLLFDEDFDLLGVYYNVSDPGSGIASVDFGLGKTKYDVKIRSYSQHGFMDRAKPYIVIDPLRLEPGVQAWVRLRAVNKVGLFIASYGNEPILIDMTPPVYGQVYDGDEIKMDLMYQADTREICAQWLDFFDPESGIESFIWGVGQVPYNDDIVKYQEFPYDVKSSCSPAVLHHNTSYFSTVLVYNRALNQKNITAVSNGVLVDTTPPVAGWIHDGDDRTEDMEYSSQTATIKAVWDNFTDPESKIAHYTVKVLVNDQFQHSFEVGKHISFTDHSIATKHDDFVSIHLEAQNGARLKTILKSDGYNVDVTPPTIIRFDNLTQLIYQSDSSNLHFKWEFADSESNLKEYRYTIYSEIQGSKLNFLPKDSDYIVVDLNERTSNEMDLQFTNLPLQTGVRYFIRVTAINNALVSTAVDQHGVIVDSTAPNLKKVLIALPDEEEELDDDLMFVVHIHRKDLYVSWKAFDPESHILESSVCLALNNDDCSQNADFRSVGIEMSTKISGALLDITSQDQHYSVFVKVFNGAKLITIKQSKKITVIQSDVPGVVFDGRDAFQDDNFQRDKSSVAISFTGFESQACGISGYEWGVGTHPFYTDIIPYTNYGLVVSNSTSGFAQIHNTNFDGVKYFASVRAKTNVNCHRKYIVSSSDGIIVDSIAPIISFSYEDGEELDHNHYTLGNSPSTGVLWNATDNVGISTYKLTTGNITSENDDFVIIHRYDDRRDTKTNDVRIGETQFVTIQAIDKAENIAEQTSAPVTYDSTKPCISNFICPTVISHVQTNVRCSWNTIGDDESKISHVFIFIGSEPLLSDILEPRNLSKFDRAWNQEMKDVIVDDASEFYITLAVTNKVRLQTVIHRMVTIDTTPPEMGQVNIVTTINQSNKMNTQICQIPTSYIDIAIEGFHDEESGIDSYKAAIGSVRGGRDILNFAVVNLVDGIATLHNLHLVEGTVVFVTLKVYNKVGLYAMTSTKSVSVSPNPRVNVFDGPTSIDEDIQTDLTIMQGHWTYSQPCPALNVEWAVEDIGGKVVKSFASVPDKDSHFYNDQLLLENMKTYINVIRVVDSLNRTRIGRSNGISVQIQPPYPGFVNDGLGEDINFQHADDTLSANWHGFGDIKSKKPSQSIDYFEVAVGNDRRYEDTRVNVVYYQNVGLNQSVTFHNLQLTKKTETYYITVRAYSKAGSFQESYSNGVKVGYRGTFIAGNIECSAAQSSTDYLEVSWSGIISDIGIREYLIGIGTTYSQQNVNNTFVCKQLDQENISANAHDFVKMGLNQIYMFTGLSLTHGESYTVLLIAQDESGMCLLMESHPVIIDITPPTFGDVQIEGAINANVMYSNVLNELIVYIDGFEDKESDINFYDLALEEGMVCNNQPESFSDVTNEMYKQRLKQDNRTIFPDILLKPNQVYYVSVKAYNQAGLMTSVRSKPIKIDASPPNVGSVHSGSNWKAPIHFQRDTDVIQAALAVSHEKHPLICENDMSPSAFLVFDDDEFSKENVIHDLKVTRLFVHHDVSLKQIIKGAVSFRSIKLSDGNYTVSINHAVGTNIFTGISFTSQDNYIYPGDFIYFLQNNISNSPNASMCNDKLPFVKYGYNFGVLIKDDSNTSINDHVVVWVQDRINLHYCTLQFPTKLTNHDYIFMLHNKTVNSGPSWDVHFLIDGHETAVFQGLIMDSDLSLDMFTWNAYHYVPPVMDPFSPFNTEATITKVRVPKPHKPLCAYGSAFSDHESGLKKIWVGLSDSKNTSANIIPFQLQYTFCNPCDKSCEPGCQDKCTLPHGIVPITLTLQNITLASASLDVQSNSTKLNSSAVFSQFKLHAYFVDIKVENHAGLMTYAKSGDVLVDTTPPHIEYVKCLDPTYSAVEDIAFLGRNDSIGVTWDAIEDVSGIVSIFVSIGTAFGKQDITDDIRVTANKSLTIDGLGGKLVHMHTYFVNVKVENGAGQRTVKSCNFTVDIVPPDTSHATAIPMFSESMNISDQIIEVTNYTDRIGLTWDNDSITGAEYYEWTIGSSVDEQDIFPVMRISTNEARRVGIIEGQMSLDGIEANPSLQEFTERNLTNMKTENVTKKKNYFQLEPGRCVYQTLHAVSKSHLRSVIHTQPECIKRKNDVVIGPGKEHVVLQKGEVITNESFDSEQIPELKIDFDVEEGGILTGVLDETAVQDLYGSAASIHYRPYIADPDLTSESLSRFLRQRFISVIKPMFYLAPFPQIRLKNRITVKRTYDKNILKPQTEVSLIYWDSGAALWRDIQESCGLDSVVNLTDTTFEAEVCGDTFSDVPVTFVKHDIKKRSITNLSSPRHFMIVVLDTRLSNSIPSILTTNIDGKEDHVLEARIEFADADDDRLTFALQSPPKHGTANISTDGVLHYLPKPDFTGEDTIEISASEVIDAPSTEHREVLAVISIRVENINDVPVLFFQNSSNNLISSEVTDLVDIELVNENTQHLLGTFWMADLDKDDNLTYFKTVSEQSSTLNFSMIPPSPSDQENDEHDLLTKTYGTVIQQQLWLYHLPGYSGSTNVSFIIMDRDKAYSRPIIIHVRVHQYVFREAAGVAVVVVCGVIMLALIVTFSALHCKEYRKGRKKYKIAG